LSRGDAGAAAVRQPEVRLAERPGRRRVARVEAPVRLQEPEHHHHGVLDLDAAPKDDQVSGRAESGDAKIGSDEDVELVDFELAAELAERAGDEAAMDGADDLGLRLRELVKRAPVHPNLAVARFRREALLVEQVDNLAGCLLVGEPSKWGRMSHEVAAPGAAGVLCLRGAVALPGDRPGEDRGEEPVFVTIRRSALRPEAVEDPRAAGRRAPGGARSDEAGGDEDADGKAGRVLGRGEPPEGPGGEVGGVEAGSRAAELLDDVRPALVAERAVDDRTIFAPGRLSHDLRTLDTPRWRHDP